MNHVYFVLCYFPNTQKNSQYIMWRKNKCCHIPRVFITEPGIYNNYPLNAGFLSTNASGFEKTCDRHNELSAQCALHVHLAQCIHVKEIEFSSVEQFGCVA